MKDIIGIYESFVSDAETRARSAKADIHAIAQKNPAIAHECQEQIERIDGALAELRRVPDLLREAA